MTATGDRHTAIWGGKAHRSVSQEDRLFVVDEHIHMILLGDFNSLPRKDHGARRIHDRASMLPIHRFGRLLRSIEPPSMV